VLGLHTAAAVFFLIQTIGYIIGIPDTKMIPTTGGETQ
jgi:hypothetical protein